MESPALRKLTETVKQAVAAGRIGAPSVVRWYVRTEPDRGRGESTRGAADLMLEAASVWLGGKPATVRRFGKSDSEIVLHATWPAGAAAVLTAASGHGEPANDLIVIGSRGAIYFGRTPEAPEAG